MIHAAATDFHYHGREPQMADATNYHAWILRQFAPFIRGSVAEVGAGSGNVSTMLLERGVERLLAIEPSRNIFPELAARLAGQPRASVHNGFLHQLAPSLSGTLDTVLYINVLEHIEDDAGQLRLARETLRPGGHVCIFVPALQALYSRFDAEVGHVRRYHRAALCRLLESVGLHVVRSRYFDIVGGALWFAAYRLLNRGIEGGHVSLYDRWVVPVVSRLEAVVPPPLGKNLLVVGVRR